VGYIAPEQLRGLSADARSDLFALGCVLYEMLAGRPAFLRGTAAETMGAILTEEPSPLPGSGGDLPAELEHAILHCLEKNREARLQSAADLAYTLRAVAAQPAVPTATATPAVDAARGRRWRWGAAAAAVALLIAAVAAREAWRRSQPTPGKAPPRIVVLPFENLGDPEDAFFADGVTEELTARLAAVRAFRVVSRTSAVKYAGTEKTVRQMGEELGVDYVLEGSVRWARARDGASRIRITPQLIRVADDTHLWAETYDRVFDDVFDVQSDIAERVTDHLGVALGGREREFMESQPTANVEAYQAYLQGRYWVTRPHFTFEHWSRAMEGFERAVELDPGFALAHGELARGHALVRYFRHDLSPERLRAADAAAARALELAPRSPRVHLDLGYYRLWAYRDIDGALAELERARGERPDDSETYEAMAEVYLVQGRWDEVLDASLRAFELSPRDAGLIANAGFALLVTRRYPEAMAALGQAVALAPDALWPRLYTALAIWNWKGSAAEARPVLEAFPGGGGDWERWAWYWQEMFEGRYREALGRLSSTTEGWIRVKMYALPNSLYAGFAYERLGETRMAEEAYEAARRLLEPEVAASPEDPRLHSSLGLVYSFQGRREAAVREGLRACDLLPRSLDGFYYLPYVVDLAQIYTIVGDREAALERLEELLANPSYISAPLLRMDPRWDPLRGDPRFEALLQRYAVPERPSPRARRGSTLTP